MESEEDVQIIKERWFFDEGSQVDFKSADAGEGGGCMQVIRRVEFDRNKGVNAFGIVDRDALLRNNYWDAWWERDDDIFMVQNPWGEYVKVLKRWEVENYLLTPGELEIVLADKELRSIRNNEEVLEEIIQKAQDAKVLSAAIILCHENGAHFPIGFGSHQTGTELLEETAEYLEKNCLNSTHQDLNKYMDKIEAFSEGSTAIDKKRWERLNRILDGKCMLRRMQLYGKSFTDRRGDLARHIRINGKIDREIVSIVSVFKETGQF